MANESNSIPLTLVQQVRRLSASPKAPVVLACIIAAFVSPTPTVNTVFGFFLNPISEEFGWSRASVSVVLLLVAVAMSITAPIVGLLIDRHGARPIIIPGVVLFSASMAALSLVEDSRLHLYLNYAMVGAAGGAIGPVIITKVISTWFDRNRGFALGVVGGVGNGAGATFMPIYVHFLISNSDWRGAYAGLGLLILAMGLPALFFLLRDAPSAEKTASDASGLQGLTLEEAVRTSAFWIVLSAVALGAGSITAVFTHVIPLLDDRGLPFEQATAVLSVFALVTVVWQICVGLLLDRFPRPRLIAPLFVAAIFGIALLMSTSNLPLLILAAVLMGVGLGTEYGVLPLFLSRYFGLKAYGVISGIVYGVITLVLGLTPFLMDIGFDITGSYDVSGYVICASLLLGALLITRLPPFKFI